MKSKTIITKNPEETIAFGKKLAKNLSSGNIICLIGDLGAGKTTFVKGLAQGLKVNPNKVSSPTFVVMNIYEGKLPIYHFDLYRMEGNEDMAMIGYEEFLYGDGIAVIEWAEHLGNLMPKDYIRIELTHHKPQGRKIKLSVKGKRYEHFIDRHLD
ncbi:tRNA threonylcarbamoyladenosine biosynthesis protein TsaE [hydrothermal vent metagenome]|uniref:tRNA threonylcarbamoyladenosine biosynthesis protein TsaE n=1 Tax=hydrothermal vent metagenome TaxID=652676 RepID=A0A3B1D0H0_9ZZZZ